MYTTPTAVLCPIKSPASHTCSRHSGRTLDHPRSCRNSTPTPPPLRSPAPLLHPSQENCACPGGTSDSRRCDSATPYMSKCSSSRALEYLFPLALRSATLDIEVCNARYCLDSCPLSPPASSPPTVWCSLCMLTMGGVLGPGCTPSLPYRRWEPMLSATQTCLLSCRSMLPIAAINVCWVCGLPFPTCWGGSLGTVLPHRNP